MLNKLKKIITHKSFIKYFINTSWMFFEQFFRLLAGVFVGIYVARYLGPMQFGIFSYAGAFVALFAALSKLGLDGVVVRELINQPECKNKILGTAFWLKVTASLVVLGVIATILPWSSNDKQTNIYIYIIAMGLLFQTFEIADFYFQSTTQIKYVSMCRTVQLAISSAVKLYLIYIEADLMPFVIVTLIDQIMLALAFILMLYAKNSISIFSYFSKSIATSLLKDSWPLIVSSLAISLYMRIDQIIIKELLGVADVGLYSAALRISETTYLVPVIICTSIFPAIIATKKLGDEIYSKRILILFESMMLASILIAIPISIFSDLIMKSLFGEKYMIAGSVLAIHVWSGVFVFMGVAAGKWMLVENITKQTMYRTLAGAIINILLNLILIPIYGIKGSALATLITCFTTSILMNYISVKTRKCFWMQMSALIFPGRCIISSFKKANQKI